MQSRGYQAPLYFLACAGLLLLGCSNNPSTPAAINKPKKDLAAEIRKERNKLSAEDRALVDAQEFCAIANEEPLGSMGPPIRLVLEGQTIFLCCQGCEKEARADPKKTLARVEQLKAKIRASSSTAPR